MMTKENPPRINRRFRIIEKRIEKKRTRVRRNKISITTANKISQFLYSNRDYSNPNKAFETCLRNEKSKYYRYTPIQSAFVVQCTKRNDQRNVGSRPDPTRESSVSRRAEDTVRLRNSNTSKYQARFCEDEVIS